VARLPERSCLLCVVELWQLSLHILSIVHLMLYYSMNESGKVAWEKLPVLCSGIVTTVPPHSQYCARGTSQQNGGDKCATCFGAFQCHALTACMQNKRLYCCWIFSVGQATDAVSSMSRDGVLWLMEEERLVKEPIYNYSSWVRFVEVANLLLTLTGKNLH